jgi:hypothetical protein
MTENQYDPENTDAATLAAFVALGAQIVALRWELQQQRERADEYQRTAAQLAHKYDEARAENIKAAREIDHTATSNETGLLDRVAALMQQWGVLRVRREGDDWVATSERTQFNYRGNTLASAVVNMRCDEQECQ